jgi:hypothetical protein
MGLCGASPGAFEFCELRIDPGAAAARLGALISKPDARLQEHLVGLRYKLSQPSFVADGAEGRQNELVDWVLTTKRGRGREDAAAHALERWRSTKSSAWMMSAMMPAQSPQPDLIAAAAAVTRNSPAWATVTYHRFRMTQDNAAVRVEIAKLLPEMSKREPTSTVNGFREMVHEKAVSLDGFMKLADMEPAGYDDGIGEGITSGVEAATGDDERDYGGIGCECGGGEAFQH